MQQSQTNMDEFVMLRRSDDGRIALFDNRDKFQASYKDGKWVNDSIFQWHALDDFTIIEDDAEICRVLGEARTALNVPLKISCDLALGCKETYARLTDQIIVRESMKKFVL